MVSHYKSWIQVTEVLQGWVQGKFNHAEGTWLVKNTCLWLAFNDYQSAGWRLVYHLMAVLLARQLHHHQKTHEPVAVPSLEQFSCLFGFGMLIRACTNRLRCHGVLTTARWLLVSHCCILIYQAIYLHLGGWTTSNAILGECRALWGSPDKMMYCMAML